MLSCRAEDLTPDLLKTISNQLDKGGLGIVPTDTIPGFICRADRPQALDRLISIKSREPEKPFLLVVPSVSLALSLVELGRLEDKAGLFWPGPVTIAAPYTNKLGPLPGCLLSADRLLAVRVPADPFFASFLTAVGGPAVSTSVNRQGEPPLCDAKKIIDNFGEFIDFFLHAGNGPSLLGSTILRVRDERVECIREGRIPFAELAAKINRQK